MTDTEAAELYSGFTEPLLSFPALIAVLLVALPLAAFVGLHFANVESRRRWYHRVAVEGRATDPVRAADAGIGLNV